MGYLDIHSHIIPNVDDGCKSIEGSMEIIRNLVNCGVSDLVATPHFINHRFMKNPDEIKAGFELVKEEVKKENLPINLYLGQEIAYSHKLDLGRMLQKNELLTINGSKYILLEFVNSFDKDNVGEIVYNFSTYGYKVILAHVERYTWMKEWIVREAINEGALIQVNATDVLGKEGLGKMLFTRKLLRKGLVDFIGSDSHSFRIVDLGKALKIAKIRYGFENRTLESLND